jgi:mono/diheme cytochrome c family protein
MKWIFLCAAMMMWQLFAQDPAKQSEEKPAVAADAKAATDAKAGEVVKLVNPKKVTPESIALGKKAYGTDCALCHGKGGAGDGDLATDMKLTLKDFRNPESLKGMTDGDIFTIIDKGKGQMSGEEGRMKPGQIWDVVNYVRSLEKK